jgi:hypothetical protein
VPSRQSRIVRLFPLRGHRIGGAASRLLEPAGLPQVAGLDADRVEARVEIRSSAWNQELTIVNVIAFADTVPPGLRAEITTL